MAQHDECVKHAVVALSGSYLLDYNSQQGLRDRVNYHYDQAKQMISVALRSRQNQDIGQGDNLVAAIMLLLVDDVSYQTFLSDFSAGFLRRAEQNSTRKKLIQLSV